MTGWIVAVVFLLAGAAVSLLLLRSLRREHGLLQRFLDEDKLRAARRRRVFEVLEILGNALQGGQPDTTMHRLIAEGAVKVVESHAHASVRLTMIDRSAANSSSATRIPSEELQTRK